MAGPYALDDLLQYMGLAKETTPGTGEAATLFVPFSGDVTLEDVANRVEVGAISGDGSGGGV